MLKAITRKEIIGKNGKLDIYSFMRSNEIREYMRNNKSFNLKDSIHIILKSMNPFDIKLEALRILGADNSLSEHERRYVLYTTRYVERILQEIYSPESSALIAMNECYCADEKGLNAYEASVKEHNRTSYYSSYNEFLEQYREYVPEADSELPRYEIDLVYQDKDWRQNNPISFSATWFNDKIEIYAIHVDSDWGETHCFKSSITDYFWCGRMGRYSLPYPTMSKVQIQTPFMKKPLFGILDSSLDGLGCWYHFFYPYDKRGLTGCFMDFSYHGIELSSDFAVFDWISKDDGEVTAEEIREIRSYNEEITPIANLQPDSIAIIIGRINQVKFLERCGWKGQGRIVHVELEDKTGKVTVPINVSGRDAKWIENAIDSNGYIKTGVKTIRVEDGNFNIEHTGGISLIKETDCEKYILNSAFSKEKIL